MAPVDPFGLRKDFESEISVLEKPIFDIHIIEFKD